MEDLTALPAEPVGEHLSDDEFISYSMETLTVEEVQRVDEHLASCPECAEQMEQLMEASEAWSGEQGKERLAALRQRVLGDTPTTLKENLVEHLAEYIFTFSELQVAYADTGEGVKELKSGETEDGRLRWKVLKKEGNVIVRFGSHVMTAGTRLHLKAGDFQCEVVLKKVAPDQVGAEVVITYEEWEQVPKNEVLQVEIGGEKPRDQSQG
jgi:hypothetical protein